MAEGGKTFEALSLEVFSSTSLDYQDAELWDLGFECFAVILSILSYSPKPNQYHLMPKKILGSADHKVAKTGKASLVVRGVMLPGAAEGAKDRDAPGAFAESLQVTHREEAGGEEGRSQETLGKVS